MTIRTSLSMKENHFDVSMPQTISLFIVAAKVTSHLIFNCSREKMNALSCVCIESSSSTNETVIMMTAAIK